VSCPPSICSRTFRHMRGAYGPVREIRAHEPDLRGRPWPVRAGHHPLCAADPGHGPRGNHALPDPVALYLRRRQRLARGYAYSRQRAGNRHQVRTRPYDPGYHRRNHQPDRRPLVAVMGVGLHPLCLARLEGKPDALHPHLLFRRGAGRGLGSDDALYRDASGAPHQHPAWTRGSPMIEIALLAIALLVLTLTLGVPLPYCFGSALMVMYFLGGVTMKGMILWGFQQLGNPVLLAIPLFVLAGTIMSASGIAASLLNFVNAIIGAISGSGLTGIAAIGPLLIPEMEKRGYPRAYATALIANSSILGLLIPPSVTMIVYGWVTDTSILACFLATLGP